MGQTQSQVLEPNLIEVEEIEIEGNTVFSARQLEKFVSPLEGKKVTLDEILRAKNEIVQFYRARGYISTSAFLPAQELKDGKIALEVVEGKLSLLEVEGLSRLSEDYIKARLRGLEGPLQIDDLIENLQQIRQDPLIKEISGELQLVEGDKTLLSLNIEEEKLIQTQLKFGNTFSPSVGNLGGEASIEHRNLLGFGDRLGVNYTRTEGLERYGFNYSLPFNADGGRLAFGFQDADSRLVEEAVSPFDIQADFALYQLVISQPITINSQEKLTLALELEHLRGETFVLKDISFPFVDGFSDGQSRITPLRLVQEYSRVRARSLFSINSKFNVGLDIFEATTTDTGIDGMYWSWQGKIQWLKAFNKDRDLLLVMNLSTQLTPDKLLPLERFSLGGLGTVRGYRQNLLIGDGGVFGIVEGQIPILKTGEFGDVRLIPFFDMGTLWSNYSGDDNSRSKTLVSTGLGLNYELGPLLDARVYYAIPLTNVKGFVDVEVEQNWSFVILFGLPKF